MKACSEVKTEQRLENDKKDSNDRCRDEGLKKYAKKLCSGWKTLFKKLGTLVCSFILLSIYIVAGMNEKELTKICFCR